MSATTSHIPTIGEKVRLPMAGLLALFIAGFLGIINETIPAGLLPEMSKSLGLSESATGQTVTIYALASAITAIPLNAVMKNWGRRTVLVSALGAFIVANATVAFVDSFTVILIARFVAGVGAGLVWSNLGGYAARLVPRQQAGKAISIAMAGTPVALSLGLPAGTILGNLAGWEATFGAVAIVSAALIVWAFISLPNLPGQVSGEHVPLTQILRKRGVRSILWVLAGFVVAHNILYTYIGPLTIASGIGGQIEWVLLAFGIAALASIFITGSFVDPHHRRLILMSTIVLGASSLVLGFALLNPIVVYVGVVAWGFGFGGATTLFLTAGTRAAGTEGVQSMIVTVFNLGIAAGGVFGGLLLSGLGVISIPWVAFILMIPTAIATIVARRHAFPRWS